MGDHAVLVHPCITRIGGTRRRLCWGLRISWNKSLSALWIKSEILRLSDIYPDPFKRGWSTVWEDNVCIWRVQRLRGPVACRISCQDIDPLQAQIAAARRGRDQ